MSIMRLEWAHRRTAVANVPKSRRRRMLAAGLTLACSLAACNLGTSPSVSGSPSGASASSPSAPTNLRVGLGYIPSVQFAQFYLAQEAGYYRQAGLDVTFNNQTDTDVITLVGQGKVQVGIADGTSVIPAVSQGIPIKFVATIYARFPNVVYAKASSGITSVADLRGKKLGTPGRYGSSWIMLQAILSSAGLRTSDLDIQLYPDFGQGAALIQGAVDAATGFINNEPVVLERSGTPVTIMRVDQTVPLPGNGLVAGTGTIATHRAALRAFVAATLRAMKEIQADPQAGLDAAIAAVPELGQDKAMQLAILKATIATWSSDYTVKNGSGAIDRAAWTSTVRFMAGLPDGPISGTPPTVDQLIDQTLLPG
jgi:NitT/TauT family transport system substrate-binding protein